MKKQNPQSKIPTPNNPNSTHNNNNRKTPPFVQFETIRQRLRISLPKQQQDNIISFKDMQYLNNNNKNVNNQMENDSLFDFSQKKQPYCNDKNNNNNNNNNQKKNKQKLTEQLKRYMKQAQKLVNKFKNKQKHNKNQQQINKNSKNKINQDKKCSPIESKKKTIKKSQHQKSKQKQKQKDIFLDIKFTQQKSKSKNIPHFYDISQYLYPKSQNLKQIYNIHQNRSKNTQSHNVQQKPKTLTHRRQCSQMIKKPDPIKNTILKKVNQQTINKKLQNNYLINKVCTNSLNSSLTYYRQHTDYDEQQFPHRSCTLKLKKQSKQIQQNSRILQQLYSSYDSQENQNNNLKVQIDSDDQCLLTMISHDIQYLKSQRNQKLAIAPQKIKVMETINRRKIQQSDTKQINLINIEKQSQQQSYSLIKYLPKDGNQEQKQAQFDKEQKQSNQQQLINKIEQILSQINKIKTNSQINNKQQQQQQQQQQPQPQNIQKKQQLVVETDQKISSSNQQINSPKSWSFGPTLLQLQIMLQKCLNHSNGQLSLQKSRILLNKQQIHKCQNNSNPIMQKSRAIYIEQKWKQNQIKQIKKAQKLLYLGYTQATKLLTNTLQLLPQSNKQKSKQKSKQSIHLRNKPKCHSMLNLHIFQNKPKNQSSNTNTTNKNKQFQTINIEQTKLINTQNTKNKPIKIEHIQISDDQNQYSIIDQVNILHQNLQFNQHEHEIINNNHHLQNQNQFSIEMQIQQNNKKEQNQNQNQNQNQFQYKQLISKYINSNNKQKIIEQIVQIIVLQLCIEIIEDVEMNFMIPQELYQALFNNIRKLKPKRKLGFNTSPSQIYIILSKFSKFLQQTIKNQSKQSYKSLIYQRIKKPIGPKPLQLLKFMRQPTEDQYDNQQNQQNTDEMQQKQSFALSLEWFHQFSNTFITQYNFGIYYEKDQQRQNKRKIFLKNALHIHNKAIFDSINQIIDKYRPYGLLGQPFPWKPHVKPTPLHLIQFHKILNLTFQEVADNCRYLCGMFPQEHMTYKLTQLQFMQFTEDRLNKMLRRYVQDNQERWNFIDDQQTEILVQVSRFITINLIKQATQQIHSISQLRKQD